MTTRTITTTLKRANDTAWAGAVITAALRTRFTTTGGITPPDVVAVTTDAGGAASLILAVPDAGTAEYYVTLPNGSGGSIYVAAGATTTLGALLASGTPVSVSAIAEHAALVASGSVLGHVKIGSGITVAADGTISAAGGGGGGSSPIATPTLTGTVRIATAAADPVVYRSADVDTLLLSYLLSSSYTWSTLPGKPSTFVPSAHATSHASGGGDVLTPSAIGASATGHAHADATISAAGFLSTADKTKLDGVAALATANATDAQLRDRVTHTGSQIATTISDLTESVQDIIGALLVAGGGVTVVYNDAANTLTISGFNSAANNTIAGEQTFTDVDKPIILGTTTQQGGAIRGYYDAIGGTADLRPALVNSEPGWTVPRLELSAGRFVFVPADSKGEMVLTGATAAFNIYNSGAFRMMTAFDLLDSATQTNVQAQHNGTLKRLLVGAVDSAGAGFRTLRVIN